MDQVGEQGHRSGDDKDRDLEHGGESEDAEADRDGADTVARADDRAVDQAMRMGVSVVLPMLMVVFMRVAVGVCGVPMDGPGAVRVQQVAVGTRVRVLMGVPAVAVANRELSH